MKCELQRASNELVETHNNLCVARRESKELRWKEVRFILPDDEPQHGPVLQYQRNVEIDALESDIIKVSTELELAVAGYVDQQRLEHITSTDNLRYLLRDLEGTLSSLRQRISSSKQDVPENEILPNLDPVSLAAVERANGLWYPDGNLIIHAGDLVFRVFCGILSEQSPVLQALLSPEKLSKCAVFDGCPVVPVPHSGSETVYFLSAIFKLKSFDSLLKRISFDAIAAVHRLSYTYQIPDLQRKSLILISSVYPTTLAEFSTAGLGPSYCRDQILPVIRFAREHSVDWILPLAFYRYCLEMTTRTLFYGVEYSGENMVLSTADQARCHEATKNMSKTNIAESLARYDARLKDDGCTGREACRDSRFREADTVLHSLGSVPDVFFRWTPEPDSKLCSNCSQETARWHDERRRAFWDGLPGLFGLPDWTILNEMKEAALREPDDDEEEVTF
ncbi:hypothetical protein B0H11DRAFT_1728704 [Mycena galericulata]|nr:hypothetical protein B0H11DRAFT_1728704 [Mycena galericulata]